MPSIRATVNNRNYLGRERHDRIGKAWYIGLWQHRGWISKLEFLGPSCPSRKFSSFTYDMHACRLAGCCLGLHNEETKGERAYRLCIHCTAFMVLRDHPMLTCTRASNNHSSIDCIVRISLRTNTQLRDYPKHLATILTHSVPCSCAHMQWLRRLVQRILTPKSVCRCGRGIQTRF